MAVLSESQTATINGLIAYLQGNHDLPLPGEVAEQLDKVFGGSSGFVCACGVRGTSLREALRDAPVRTLLRLIIAVSEGLPETPAGPLPPA